MDRRAEPGMGCSLLRESCLGAESLGYRREEAGSAAPPPRPGLKEGLQHPGLAGVGSGSSSLLGTHSGWGHWCWLQRLRMGLGLFLWSHRCRCTM